MIINKQVLLGKSGYFIKLVETLSNISNAYGSDIKLLKSGNTILNFCFGIEYTLCFDDELLSEIRAYCKAKELKLKTKKLKKTTLCQILLG